jgi:type I restriction enzyme S subunit
VFRTENAAHVSEETYFDRVRRAVPTHGDLLYSREGTYFGIAAEVPANTRVCLGQRMVLIRPAPDRADFRFLKYWLNSSILEAHVYGSRDGTVAERLNLPTIRGLAVPVAPLREQRAIAVILGALDDKIELNRRMNEALESMARAIFKSWFVDFDPVRAKMEGRQPAGIDADTAALFPDAFEGSPLRAIPKGWRMGAIDEVATNPRRSIDPAAIAPDTPYIGLEHIPRQSIIISEWGHASDISSVKVRFCRGEILFGKLRPYFHKVGVALINGVCSTDILTIAPKDPEWLGFALGHLSSPELVNHADACSTGTKMPRVHWVDIARYEIALPPNELASLYTSRIRALMDLITCHVMQSHTLAAIRDALLPKLLSGEIRVGETGDPSRQYNDSMY